MHTEETLEGRGAEQAARTRRRRVLILGGGFGGMYTALYLDRHLAGMEDVEVTLVSRQNYFLFTPMLIEVAASDLDPDSVVVVLRKVLRHAGLFEGDVTGIDLEARKVRVVHGGLDAHEHTLGYDYLVLGLGSGTNFFGKEGPREHSLTMKTLADAVLLRERLITRLEEADAECVATGDRGSFVTFAVVGGGFAGVETAGAINDFIHGALRFYRRLEPHHVRVVLLHSGAELLPELGADLGAYARRKLGENGVEVHLHARVADVDAEGVTLMDGTTVLARTVVWTAGIVPPTLLQALPFEKVHGRLVVNERLEVPGHPGVWALGDCAAVPDPRGGRLCPPTAQHAMHQGRTAALNVLAALRGGRARAFRYKMQGQLAAIGHRTGVANILGLKFSGFAAWFLWRVIYLWKLPRVEKKVRVALGWALDLFFRKDVVQFISPREQQLLPIPRPGHPVPAAPPAPEPQRH